MFMLSLGLPFVALVADATDGVLLAVATQHLAMNKFLVSWLIPDWTLKIMVEM